MYISELSYSTDNGGMVSKNFSDDYNHTSTDRCSADMVMSAIERALANDLTSYYDVSDVNNGAEYSGNFTAIRLGFNWGDITLSQGDSQRKNVPKKVRCIRYLGSNFMRSLYCTNESEISNKKEMIDYTEYNTQISKGQWFGIMMTYNKIMGKTVMGIEGTKLTFNFDEVDDTKIAKGIYLLVSEVLLTEGDKVVLVALDKISAEVQERLETFLKQDKGVKFVYEFTPNSSTVFSEE